MVHLNTELAGWRQHLKSVVTHQLSARGVDEVRATELDSIAIHLFANVAFLGLHLSHGTTEFEILSSVICNIYTEKYPVDYKLWNKYANKLPFDAELVHLIDPRVPYVNPTSFPGVSRSQARALLEITCLS